MATLAQIASELDRLLSPATFKDYCPNGVQVPPTAGGKQEIELVVTAVSADAEVLEQAAELGAQLVLVHHGLFWQGPVKPLDQSMARRLRVLLSSDIALAAYHLPLDGHPALGNNALLAGALGADFELWEGSGRPPIGVGATLADALTLEELAATLEPITGQTPQLFAGGEHKIERLAIVSGGAAGMLPEAAADGFDALLTGEPKEQTRALAAELGIHAICGGHHGTERLGVKALGSHLEQTFGVKHQFIDTDNWI